jgi:hypothetical protein
LAQHSGTLPEESIRGRGKERAGRVWGWTAPVERPQQREGRKTLADGPCRWHGCNKVPSGGRNGRNGRTEMAGHRGGCRFSLEENGIWRRTVPVARLQCRQWRRAATAKDEAAGGDGSRILKGAEGGAARDDPEGYI